MQEHTYHNHTIRTAKRKDQPWFSLVDVVAATGRRGRTPDIAATLPSSQVIHVHDNKQAQKLGFTDHLGRATTGMGAYFVNLRGAIRIAKQAESEDIIPFLRLVVEAAVAGSTCSTYTDIENPEQLTEILNSWETEAAPGVEIDTLIAQVKNHTKRIAELERQAERLTLAVYIQRYQGGRYIGAYFGRFLAICFATAREQCELVHWLPKGMDTDGFIPIFTLDTLHTAWQQLEV